MIRHESQRGYFAYSLWREMKKNENIYLICIDLGYKVFDQLIHDYPTRAIITGASEQAALDVAVGLAYEEKIPFVYSITPFLLYRPFETLRTYLNNENLNVKLVGSGRDNDYKHDGYSHFAGDDKKILNTLSNIKGFWPKEKELIPNTVSYMIKTYEPQYLNLSR